MIKNEKKQTEKIKRLKKKTSLFPLFGKFARKQHKAQYASEAYSLDAPKTLVQKVKQVQQTEGFDKPCPTDAAKTRALLKRSTAPCAHAGGCGREEPWRKATAPGHRSVASAAPEGAGVHPAC